MWLSSQRGYFTAWEPPNRFSIVVVSATGLEVLRLPHSAAITHRRTPVATLGLSAHVHSLLSSRHRPFGPLSGCPRGSLRSHMLPVVPPGPLEVGGPGAEGQGPVVGCFSQQQLSYWAASTRDPSVLSTLTHGYKLQFRRRPPAYGRVKMTIIHDPAKAQALTQELSALLDKVAMKACPSPQRVDGILRLLLLFREGRLLRYVEFLRLLGKLTAAATVVPLGLLSLRPLQRWLHSFHLDVRWHRHRGLKTQAISGACGLFRSGLMFEFPTLQSSPSQLSRLLLVGPLLCHGRNKGFQWSFEFPPSHQNPWMAAGPSYSEGAMWSGYDPRNEHSWPQHGICIAVGLALYACLRLTPAQVELKRRCLRSYSVTLEEEEAVRNLKAGRGEGVRLLPRQVTRPVADYSSPCAARKYTQFNHAQLKLAMVPA
ncbi:unnamed protein product [Boreogadus saida]